jgi:hypothetical protein
MRIMIATCAGLLTLGGISVQAAPLPIAKAYPTGITASPPIELVAQGCGYGQRRTYWQDQWGRCIRGAALRRRGGAYRANSFPNSTASLPRQILQPPAAHCSYP